MPKIRFKWDRRKSRSNEHKHGISFEEAQTVFLDEGARLLFDPEHSGDEDRFALLGLSARLRMLVVCHCYREDETVIRIISARPATRHERLQYEEFLR
jgi:uncharacterized protein